jgi:hypothetical protein
MNANNDNDNGWTTVRSGAWAPRTTTSSSFGTRQSSAFGSSRSFSGQQREMPSAFSGRGGDDDRVNRRREQDRMNAEVDAAIKAREARERREALDAARAKERDALALDSETSYPSLGGAAAARPYASTLNFGRTVATMAAREKAEEEARAAAAAASLEYTSSSDAGWIPTHRSRRRFIGTRCFDDGPEDYDGPEEDFGDYMSDDGNEEEDGAEEGTGEFNAELAVTHRRGNKNSLY